MILITALLFLAGLQTPPSAARIDAAFQKFWNAGSPDEAARLVDGVIASGVAFDEAWRRLKTGRTYSSQATGIVKLSRRSKEGTEYFYALNVPANYDPAKRYAVRFQLHGGVGGRDSNRPRGTGESPLQGAEQIYVVPYSWNDSPWWSEDQTRNLAAITDSIKRTYNVDENRVALAGVSDGGTGAFFIAMRDTTPYSSILPLNAFIMVLGHPSIDDGLIYPNNLRNKPMFVINGGRDQLYPTFTRHLMRAVRIDYHPQPEAGHNTAWWPDMKDTFEKFVAEHPRDPHPDTLTWETGNSRHNRAHWLVIDQLGPQANDARSLSDLNLMGNFRLFRRPAPSGRVDLVRNGNTIEATTRGVAAFTLLVSPDEFDFAKPIRVAANGRTVFDGRVQRDLKTLLKWAAADNDRSMLYGAEVKIRLGR